MAPAARLKVLARAALLGTALALLAGCSLFGGKDDETNNANKDAANYRERSVEQIYADGWRAINAGAWEVCAAQFNEVDRQHPYSVWARRAMLISAFCSYQANAYPQAIATDDQYISLHPGSPEVAYAFYIKAISLYEQIVDIGRDQSNTEGALVALQDVVQRFPDTEYARDATLKIDLTMDHLAGKEMAVGRYYLTRGDYIGAINRFRVVIDQFQTTPQIAEALERLTESYYSLGLDSEAQTAAAVLGANYPGTVWYQDSFNILKGRNLTPLADQQSWIYKAFHKMLLGVSGSCRIISGFFCSLFVPKNGHTFGEHEGVMLAALTVRDIVLIEQAALEFAPGLNVLTGETGAGKSILLDSLGLAIGGPGGSKARAGVRPGAAQGSATAVFDPSPKHASRALLLE